MKKSENKWNEFSQCQPKEVGYYDVKIMYDRNIDCKVKWNGEDFVLGIGKPITHEVVAWR